MIFHIFLMVLERYQYVKTMVVEEGRLIGGSCVVVQLALSSRCWFDFSGVSAVLRPSR